MRVGVAAPEHGDHLNGLHPPGARCGVSLLRPGQLPVRERPAVAVVTGVEMDGAAAAQEDRVRLVKDPPHDRIQQANGAAEDRDPLGPCAGSLVCPRPKVLQVAGDVRGTGWQILGHAPIIPGNRAGTEEVAQLVAPRRLRPRSLHRAMRHQATGGPLGEHGNPG